MLVTGYTVQVNLPDAQLHITMDRTHIEMKEAAEKFSKVGRSPYEDFFKDMGNSNPFSDSFDNIFPGSKKKR